MIRVYMTALALGCAAVAVAPVHAGDAEAGKNESRGVLGVPRSGRKQHQSALWPKLAGQHAAYLTKQMKAFRSGERKDPVMAPMAMPLSDADIEDISAFYASQVQK